MSASFLIGTTVLGLDWYILLLVVLTIVVVAAFALSAAGLWKLGSLGRRGPDRKR